LTIARKGVDHPIDVKLARSVIHVVPVKYQAEDDVGYTTSLASMSRPPLICKRPLKVCLSYVSPEKNKDTQLQYALELMRGIRSVDTNANQQ
jgi:hypothetical protein